jgi:hypothetical protein
MIVSTVTDSICSACGKGLAASDVLYTSEAAIICAECAGKAEIVGDERNAARNIKIAAFTCLGAALMGFGAFMVAFGLGFWSGAIISVSSGLYVLNAMIGAESERFTRYLSAATKSTIWLCTLAGLAIAAYETLAMFGIIRFHFYLH